MFENISEFYDESDMSEITVEDEVDCSEFVKNESKKNLISKNSIEFTCISENKSSKNLKEKSTSLSKSSNCSESGFRNH